MVIPPKSPLRKSSLIFFFLFKNFLALKTKGSKIKMLIKFLKNACSIGCINCELNLTNAAIIENKRHDKMSKKIGDIFIKNYSFLQFICICVNKNNEF